MNGPASPARHLVLANGGKIAGLVYFPKTKQDLAAFTLRADLVDATTEQSLGRVEIPLAVVKN
ncbi:MAG TPA: hypothetical protein VJ801_10175 [Polyangia bacterium]|nr:hypothetical protein [Polyangia bacterium]